MCCAPGQERGEPAKKSTSKSKGSGAAAHDKVVVDRVEARTDFEQTGRVTCDLSMAARQSEIRRTSKVSVK